MEQEKKNRKTADDSMRGVIRRNSVPLTDEELRRENARMREERWSAVSECVFCRVRMKAEEASNREIEMLKKKYKFALAKLKIAKEVDDLKRQKECCVCINEKADVLFLPCHHVVSCMSCAQRIRRERPAKCPVCRKEISQSAKVYFA